MRGLEFTHIRDLRLVRQVTPSHAIAWPVTYLDSSEARNAASAAIADSHYFREGHEIIDDASTRRIFTTFIHDPLFGRRDAYIGLGAASPLQELAHIVSAHM
jgi:hypothetical protein